MTIFLQTSSTGVPSSACFSAEAICCSVNLLLFTAWLLFYGGIMPEFLFLNGTIYWGRVNDGFGEAPNQIKQLKLARTAGYHRRLRYPTPTDFPGKGCWKETTGEKPAHGIARE